jgi:hypothetical protein
MLDELHSDDRHTLPSNDPEDRVTLPEGLLREPTKHSPDLYLPGSNGMIVLGDD